MQGCSYLWNIAEDRICALPQSVLVCCAPNNPSLCAGTFNRCSVVLCPFCIVFPAGSQPCLRATSQPFVGFAPTASVLCLNGLAVGRRPVAVIQLLCATNSPYFLAQQLQHEQDLDMHHGEEMQEHDLHQHAGVHPEDDMQEEADPGTEDELGHVQEMHCDPMPVPEHGAGAGMDHEELSDGASGQDEQVGTDVMQEAQGYLADLAEACAGEGEGRAEEACEDLAAPPEGWDAPQQEEDACDMPQATATSGGGDELVGALHKDPNALSKEGASALDEAQQLEGQPPEVEGQPPEGDGHAVKPEASVSDSQHLRADNEEAKGQVEPGVSVELVPQLQVPATVHGQVSVGTPPLEPPLEHEPSSVKSERLEDAAAAAAKGQPVAQKPVEAQVPKQSRVPRQPRQPKKQRHAQPQEGEHAAQANLQQTSHPPQTQNLLPMQPQPQLAATAPLPQAQNYWVPPPVTATLSANEQECLTFLQQLQTQQIAQPQLTSPLRQQNQPQNQQRQQHQQLTTKQIIPPNSALQLDPQQPLPQQQQQQQQQHVLQQYLLQQQLALYEQQLQSAALMQIPAAQPWNTPLDAQRLLLLQQQPLLLSADAQQMQLLLLQSQQMQVQDEAQLQLQLQLQQLQQQQLQQLHHQQQQQQFQVPQLQSLQSLQRPQPQPQPQLKLQPQPKRKVQGVLASSGVQKSDSAQPLPQSVPSKQEHQQQPPESHQQDAHQPPESSSSLATTVTTAPVAAGDHKV